MIVRVPCTRCGVTILEGTAAKYAGLCAPCAQGTREHIEAAKRLHAEEEERRRNPPPESLLWTSLVRRVHDPAQGLSSLSENEQIYYLANIAWGEVVNGGFDQYFFNSSGDHYDETRLALRELGAARLLELLENAAKLLFGDRVVPADETKRRALLIGRQLSNAEKTAIDALEKQFWDDPDTLAELLSTFARRSQLLASPA